MPLIRSCSRLLVVLVGLIATGCPPTGDPPPFLPIDFEGAIGDTAVDMTLPDAAPDAVADARPDQRPEPPIDAAIDMAPVDDCANIDGDGYVVAAGCPLPAGDCDPEAGEVHPGADEACNGRDDDCDEAIDEGDPGVGADCQTEGRGICAPGRTACRDGALACDALARPSAAEHCDGVDDDCDGRTDEDDPEAGADCAVEGALGACAPGIWTCAGGALGCTPLVEARPERCNGVDDDCDGAADEADPEGGDACDTGLRGICRLGRSRCAGGSLICELGFEPVSEACNGLDDDCDGPVDEAFPTLGDPCIVGEGACRRESVLVCDVAGEGVICDARAGDGSPERCDGDDDDCDGLIDEGFGVGDACVAGVGACARDGTRRCVAAGDRSECDVEPGPSEDERCDGGDHDCDGLIDEGFPVGQDCALPADPCPARGVFVCADDGQSFRCDAEPAAPSAERCNGLDDDCDQRIDEDFADALGDRCVVGDGACRREGINVCAADGQVGCGATPGDPRPELCDGIDDDCDGRVDNRAPCAGPPAAVVRMQVAAADDPRCADLDGDGQVDNALGAIADVLNARLTADQDAGARSLLLRAPGYPPDPGQTVRVELVEAWPTPLGPLPLQRSVEPAGPGRQAVEGVAVVNGRFVTASPGALAVPSPIFYDRGPDFTAFTLLDLALARVTGEVQPAGEGLRVNGAVLTGAFDRFALLDAASEAAAACLRAGAGAPAACALFRDLPPPELSARLVADVDRDRTPGPDALSVCLVFNGGPLPETAIVPDGGLPCAADSDCARGLTCRPVPRVLNPADGAALAERCGVPGAGGAAFGQRCATDDQCLDALCAQVSAAGGQCSDLCAADADCPVGFACRGVARPVEGATTQGGASAKLCVAALGSGLDCAHDADCPADEVCGVWLAGAGVAGGPVVPEGHCQTPDPAGAPIGAACASDFDCAHGGGCVPGLDDRLWCAAPCDGAGQCGEGEICAERDLMPAMGGAPAVQQGFCLPVPPELGSGTRCDADRDCLSGETCAGRTLATTGAVESYCARGPGPLDVGQPCAEGDDCASGQCLGGFCGGRCAAADDCGPFLGCVADAAGGQCAPAALQCQADPDCAGDPACAGGRCACRDGACLVGCAPGGACADPGARCGDDGRCAPYCRDDDAEPNDTAQTAAPLALHRSGAPTELRRSLCARSPVDWYEFDPNRLPFQVRVERTNGDEAAALSLDLIDDAGRVLQAGAQVPALGIALLDVADAARAAQLASPLWLRVRAAGVAVGLDYRLTALLAPPPCDDPDEPTTMDEPYTCTELAATPGAVAAEQIDGRLCAGDVDWYAVYLGAQGHLSLTVDVLGDPQPAPGPGRAAVGAQLIGPDLPGLPGAAVRAEVPVDAAGGVFDFTPAVMRCPPGGGVCQYAGDDTARPCLDDADCAGATWFLRVAGRDGLDRTAYRLDAEVDRPAAPTCVPDPWEPDADPVTARVVAGLSPGAVIDPLRPLLAPDQPIESPGRRACGLSPAGAPPGAVADIDRLPTALRAGERLIVTVIRPPEALVPLTVEFAAREGADWRFLGAIDLQQAEETTSFDAPGDGLYAVGVIRPLDVLGASPYALRMRRETAAARDRGCADARPIAVVAGVPTVLEDTTEGLADRFQPLGCAGGDGPDSAFAVTVPAAPGVLTATVLSLDADFDPAVSIRDVCALSDTERACNEDDAEAPEPRRAARTSVSLDGRAAQVVVIVDGHDGEAAGAYRLTLEWRAM